MAAALLTSDTRRVQTRPTSQRSPLASQREDGGKHGCSFLHVNVRHAVLCFHYKDVVISNISGARAQSGCLDSWTCASWLTPACSHVSWHGAFIVHARWLNLDGKELPNVCVSPNIAHPGGLNYLWRHFSLLHLTCLCNHWLLIKTLAQATQDHRDFDI